MDDKQTDAGPKGPQFSLRALFLLIAAVSALLAAWRTTDSTIVLLLGIQAFFVWIVWLDARVFGREDFNCVTGCAAVVAIVVLPWLFVATLVLLLLF